MNTDDTKKPKPFNLLIGLHGLILLVTLIVLIVQKGDPTPSKEKIVVIPIEGMITMQRGSLGPGQSVMDVVKTINRARDNDDVKALVLRINSPGGSVGAVQEIFRALKKFKGKGKFIVSSFGDVSASGGYYLACAGDSIITNPGTITGSIGVMMQLPVVQGLLRKVGVSMETIKSGDFKDAGSPFRRMSAREKRYFKSLILDAYDQFFQAVKEGRSLEENALKKLADGRIFSGRSALQHKLVDELGGLEEAIEKAKELAGLKDKDPQIIHKKEKRSLERLMDLLGKSPLASLTPLADNQIKLMYVLQ